jgi:predicted MFS family arabinose efflux permease
MGSVLGSYAGGWLTDRKNFFDVMLFSLIGSGCLLFLMLLVTTPFAISAVIFIYAFTADMFRPANSKAISLYSEAHNRTRSVSLVRLAVNLGFSIGPAAGGFIAMYLGYKWLFVIDALTSLAAAVMLYFYLPRHEDEHKKASSSILSDRTTSAYRDYTYLTFIFLVAVFGMCFFQLFASVPQYFSTVCYYNEDTIGLLLALNGFLVVIIEMPFIAFLEKKQKLFPFIIAGVLCIPISFGILEFGNGIMFWAIIYTLIITMSEIFAMPFMMNYALSRPDKARQGQYSALYSISYGLANIAAPLIGLGIADRFGFSALFYFLIVFGLLAAGGFYLLSKKDEREKNLKVIPSPTG